MRKHARVIDMADKHHVRRFTAGQAGSQPHAQLALLALVGTASILILAAGLTLTSLGLHTHRGAPFTERILGPPSTGAARSRVVTHHASSKTRVTIDRSGASITRAGQTVALATAGAGNATWQPHANGFLRRTPFGNEAIVDTGTRTELYLGVDSKVGLHTWRWHLGDVRASLAGSGTVKLAKGMVVRAPAIFDTHGANVTPAGAHWSLDRSRHSTDLLLRLDDAHLSTPYTIDPEIDYGSGTSGTLYLTNTVSSFSKVASGTSPGTVDKFATTSPGAALCTATATGTCPAVFDGTKQNTGADYFMPFVGNKPPAAGAFVASASIVKPTVAKPFGFIVENPGSSPDGTVIPAGNWTFTVPTYTPTAVAAVSSFVSVGAWIVTDSAGSISAIGTQLIDPTVTIGATDLTATATPRTVTNTLTVNPGKVVLASNQHVLVAFYAIKNTSSNTRINADIYLGVNGSGTLGATAVAAATLDTPTALEVPAAPTSLTSGWVKASAAALSASYSTIGTAATDQGRVDFFLCSTNADCSAGAPVWTGNSTSAVLTNAVGGTATVGSALTNGAPYYLEARGEATDPGAANTPYGTAITGALSSLTTLTADGAAPVDVLSLTAPNHASKSGSTIYYKGDVAGSFQLHDAATDTAGSGVASSTFGLLSGGAGFSAHTAETVAGNPADSTAITWAAASGSPTIPVHSTDVVGNAGADTTLTLTSDTSISTVGVVSVPATVKALSVPISTPTLFADAGSGMASTSFTRSNGQAPVANVCPAGGYSGSTVVTSPDVTVANGQCYLYTYTATDNVGNTATTTSSPVLVDTTAPTDAITLTAPTGASKSGTTIYYKGNAAGSFKLRNTVTDAASGPASATFGLLTGGAGFSAHTSETASTPAGGPYDSTAITWTAASGNPTIPANATDTAGNTSTPTTLTLTPDNTLPSGGTISVPAFATATSVTITTGNFGDADSGISTNTITRSNAQAPVGSACPVGGYSGSTVVTSPDATVANGQCYLYTLTGTDKVGNTATATSSPVLVDTTTPLDAITLTAATGAAKSGSTIYYKGNAAGSFKLRDTVTDTLSGPASATFGLLSGGAGFSAHAQETVAAPAGGPYDSTAITWAAASGSPTIPVNATDTAGNTSTPTTLTLTLDNTVPTGGSISVPAFVTSTSVAITSTNYTDAGAGINTNTITRSNGQTPVGGACPAAVTFTGATAVTSPDAGVADGQCYVYTLTGTDTVGNVVSIASAPVLVDTTAPADAFSLSAPSGAYKIGSTIYYKGNAAGSFKLRDTVTDAGSGPGSATFGLLSGIAGMAHTSETIGGTSPYDSSAIAWASASGSGSISANGTDAAGNSAGATAFALTLDNTAPGGGSISVPAFATSTSVTITSTSFTDGGSQLAAGSNTITRSNAQVPVNGVCPGSGWSGATAVTSPDAGVVDGRCYVYTLTATDNVGNVATAVSAPVLVDTSAPTDAVSLTGATGAFLAGTTVYYKGDAAGSFKLRNSVTDSGSAPASATFGLLSGGAGFSTHTSETVSTPAGGPYDSSVISWTAASGAPTIAVHSTDGASNSSGNTVYTLANDTTPPALTVGAPAANTLYGGATAYPLAWSGTTSDGGSSLSSVKVSLEDPAGTYWNGTTFTGTSENLRSASFAAGAWTYDNSSNDAPSSLTTNGTYTVHVVSTDHVGNQASSSFTFTYDNTPPAYASSAADAAGTHVDLTLTEAGTGLDTSAPTPTSAFAVSGDTVTGVSYTDATHIRLTLQNRLFGDATPTVTYTPGALTTAQKVKDLAGNLLAGVVAQSISMTAVPSLTQSTVTSAPASITADGSSTAAITVQLKNAAGANLGGSGGTVALAVGAGSLGAVTDHGDGTYTATLTSATVAQSTSVTGTLDGSSLTGAAAVTYAPGAATKLAYGVQPPASVVAGQFLSPSVTVRVLDANNNLVSSGASITLAIGTNPGGATLSGTTTRSAVAGVATFNDLSLDRAGAGYTLSAASGSLTGATSNGLTVTSSSAATIASAAGDNQSATVDTSVATAPSVLVTDAFGNPVAGAPVTFAAASGGGSVTGGSASTNGSGVATVGSWKLGTSAGANSLTATSGSLAGSPIAFHATGTAGNVAAVAVNGGNNQTATVDTNVSTAPSALVTDAFGNPVGGAAVTFTVASGGGSVTGAAQSTEGAGIDAVGSWKLGTTAGANTLTAAASAGSATFSATGIAGSAGAMAIDAGEGQTATVDTNVATAPTALVTDAHGNPVSGVTVTFSVGSGGGSVTGASATTNGAGIATLGSWKLGTGAGANTLTVTSAGLTSLTFHATGTAAAAASIAIGAGDNQSATVDSNLGVAPSVVVTDTYGNPVAGAAVTFAVATGGGSGTGLSASTASNGRAAAGSWKLGTLAGANTLTATASVGSVTFNATGTAGSIDHLVLSPASSSVSADVGSEAFTAEGRDAFDNTLGDVTGSTSFSLTGGTCIAATCTATTAGAHTATGTMLGATGTATLTITAGAPATVSAQAGDNQSASAGAAVSTAPAVHVVDQFGNAVGGAAVTFAAATGGGSVTGASAVTDASGNAAVGSWTLGTAAGSNTLSATTSAGVVTFDATATAGAAASIARSAGEGQSAVVDTAVGTAPSVLVTDLHGNPVAGIAVTFAVASGSGSLTGTVQTTDPSGIATVGSWQLGTTAGANTVTATTSAGAVTFHATGTHDTAAELAVAGGDSQSATVDTNVGTAPSVLATDQFGNAVPGVSVTFAVASGGGSATGLSQTTDSSGLASVGSWQLGASAGANTLSATSSGLGGSPLTFHATGTAGAASSIAVAGGDNQSATVDTNVSSAPSVLVTDAHGNPVAGATVTFTVGSGGGSLTGGTATTDASGNASVGSWKLGTGAGANTLNATSGALAGSPVTFNAIGVAGAGGLLAINSGDNQSTTVSTSVPAAPSVLVTDTHGNPVAGVTVTFAVGSGGGSVTGATPTSDASGIATVGSWTLGTAAGANTLTAGSAGLTSVTLHATGTAASAASVAVASGDNQSATVDTTVSSAPSVLVTDTYGNPVAGAAVTFAVASGNGSGTGLVQSTDGAGNASAGSWKLGTTAGGNTLTATTTGGSVTFNATGLAGSAGAMAIDAGEGQSATVNTNVATAPSVLVTDAHGNPVAGTSVTFAVATGAGTVTSATRLTDASGLATVGSWQLGTTAGAGANTLSVTSAGLPSVTFHATGLAGTAANIDPNAGDSQTATVATTVGTGPSVIASDAYGNPVSGVAVTFAVASGGGSGTGLVRLTGSDGVAAVGSWRLGTLAGSNTLTATSSVGVVAFTATGTPGAATALAVSSGDGQSATANTAVSTAPAALVTDQYGNGVAGVAVTFAIASGGGSATSLSQVTGPTGIATVGSWTLGTVAGSNTLTAGSSAGTATFHATALADSAASIAVSAGDNQSATVNTTVSTAPAALVSDQYGNPVAGVTVTFAVAAGGGAATGLVRTSGADGVATVGSWQLGTGAGANTLSATAGVGSITFHATGLAGSAGSLSVAAGEGQTATVDTAVATAPAVLVSDQFGNPVPGVGVSFSGGTVTGANATTGADGIATVGSWTLGTTAGANTLTATASAGSVTFHATGSAGAATALAVSGGDNQSATVDTNVSAAPSVVATDQFGNVVQGVAVTFAVASGAGTSTGNSATTGVNGVATVGSWKLGTTAGANTLTATTSAGSVTFHATGLAGSAGSLSIDGGEAQSAAVNTNVGTAPSVLVDDTHGNPIQGVAVTFAIASGGGSLTGANATTDASGIATLGSWKLGTTAGANTLTVTSAGLPSATLHATGLAGSAASIAIAGGDNESATVHTAVATAPSVVVTDSFGNPVSGVPVTFAAGSGGGSLTGANASTDGSGLAAVGSWQLGTAAVANTLTASSGSLTGSPVTFHSTATPGSLDHLVLSPASSSVSAGTSQSFSAEGRDTYDNSLGDVTASTTFAIAGGSCVGAVCSATGAGAHAVTATMVGANGSATLTVTAGAAVSIAANGGDNQTATVNTSVTAPSVLVADAYGNPVSGAVVSFAVASGAGSLTGASATTGSNGVASVGSWTLGTSAGANSLSATSSAGVVTFHASATADAAAAMALSDGEGQTATIATNVATPPSALVTDAYGNPVAGVGVTFAVSSGGGSITGANASSDASGIATVGSWTLGGTAGANTITATSTGLAGSPLTFHATGAPESVGTISVSGGEGQSATAGTTVSTAPTVHAVDTHGNPVPGLAVTFSAGSGGGSVTGGAQVTDASGNATVGSWTLGTTAGPNTLTVTATNFTSAPVHATATADAPTSIVVQAGESQTATVDTDLATATAVRVGDQYGNPVAGVAVTFAVASGGGSVTGGSATTGVNGVATIGSWKLGTAAGANTLSATSAIGTITFHASGTAGSAAAMGAVAGDGQSATVNTSVSTAPAVLVVDAHGNPVTGASVTFSGGTVTGAAATTGANGVATVGSWTLATVAGGNALTASSAGLTDITFHATGIAGAATQLTRNAGESQSATVDTTLATAPSVLASDQFGNPVAGVAVTFAVASGGGLATGLSPSTDASGIATAGSWKLGTTAGANTLTATASAGTATFHATGTAGNVDHLVVSPASATITADDTQPYAVEGRDAFDNSLGDVTGSTTLTVDGLPCIAGICAAAVVGDHAVSATMLGASGSATLHVSSGAPTRLVFVSPNTANLALGGQRTFTVAVEDAQGNVVTSDNSTSITVARTAGPGDVSGGGAATVSGGSASKQVTAATAGQVTLTASATGLASAAVLLTIDPAPVATIDTAPSTSANATFAYSANDPAATFECSLDGAPYATCAGTGSGSAPFSSLAIGSHTFDVRAVSTTATGPSAHAAWIVDTSSPTVSLTLPADGSFVTTASRALAATAADTGTGVSAVDFEFSATPGADCSSGSWTLIGTALSASYDTTWTTPADGTYALRAVAHDGAGHAGCALVHVTVDQTAPSATLTSPAASVAGRLSLHATGVADATSGINSVTFERTPHGTLAWALSGTATAQGGGAYDAAFDTTSVADGLYDFRVTVTDVAGNITQQSAGPVRIDNTAPSSTLDPVAANVRQTIALSSSANDGGGSGVATTGYEISAHGVNTWTPVTASFDTTTKLDGDYDLRAVATDAVGNVGYSAIATTKIDNTPPAASLDAIARYVRGSLSLTSTTNDGGSGLATVRYELSAHGAGSWSATASPLDTTTQADGDYDVRVVAIDNAGNRTDSVPQLVTVDNTAPDAALDAPASGSIVRGTIDLASTVSDATSGVSSITYRIAPAGTPEATPCDTWGASTPAHLDTTSLADGLYDLRVVAIDNAGNGRCSAFSTGVRVDNTAPQTTDDAPASPQNHDVTVHLAPSDGGSGVASTSYSVDGGPQQSGTTVVIPAAGNDGTHAIAYSSTDVAGNNESVHTAHVTIDTTAPTGGAGNAGNAVHGDYVLTDSPTDTISAVEFFYRSSPSDPWTSVGDDTDGSDGWHVTWATAAVSDGTYHLQMVETDAAGNDTTTPLADTTVDNTAPSSASVSVSGCGAECSGPNVTFNATADASMSGIGAIDFQVKTATSGSFATVATQTSGLSYTWNSTSVADGPVDVRIAATDKAGNGPTYSAPVTITVDNNAPTVALSAPALGSGSVALGASGSADIASVAYERSPHGAGTWAAIGTASSAPFTLAWATGALADGSYDIRATATDGGGNTGSDLRTISLDNTAPTGAMTQPAVSATVGGPAVALAATSSDAGSGVDHVTFQYREAGTGGSFTGIASSLWDTTALSSGAYELRAEIVDHAGNVDNTPVRPVTVDSTPPTLSLAGLAAVLSGTVNVDASIAGAAQASLQVNTGSGWTTVGSAAGAPFTFAFDTTSVSDGLADVRVVAQDAYGNAATDTRTAIRIDNTPPSVLSSTPQDGTLLAAGTPFTSVSLVASEPLAALNSLQLDGNPLGSVPVLSGSSATVSFADPGQGAHYLTGTLVDAAGKTTPFRVNVTILPSDTTLWGMPPTMKNAPAPATTQLSAADSSAAVVVPPGAYTAPSSDFLVLSIEPTPASIAPLSGFSMVGSIVDVTMKWNSTGVELHHFDVPLRIDLADPTGGSAIPATYESGSWRLIPALQDPAVLPAGQPDGFFRDGSGVHILTRHLTMFTLVRDAGVAPSAPPAGFSAVVAADGLTLRWAPGMDGNRIQNFVLYVDGQPYRWFGPSEFETKLGAFTADDTRSFTLAEINTSGVSSPQTTALQAVPPLAGLSLSAAKAALAARGFAAGKVMPVVSSAPTGTIVAPAGVQVLPAGTAIDLQVSTESIPREAQFVLRVAVQKRIRATNHALVTRVLSTAPATIAATLDGAHYLRLARWSFPGKAGATIRTLPLRRPLQAGTYTLYLSGRTADGGYYRTSRRFQVIAASARAHTAQPTQIVVTVTPTAEATERALAAVGQATPASPDESFDVAAGRDAAVVVVDADAYGLALVRNLHAVFPGTAIVALSAKPATLAAAARAGAVAVPASTPPAKLATLVARLALP